MASACSLVVHVVMLALLLPASSAEIPAFMRAAYRAQRGRELALCERHDDSDSSVARCDEWCKYPAHCDFCKCRACSLCKPCSSKEPNDLAYEGCEEWCSAPEHCLALQSALLP